MGRISNPHNSSISEEFDNLPDSEDKFEVLYYVGKNQILGDDDNNIVAFKTENGNFVNLQSVKLSEEGLVVRHPSKKEAARAIKQYEKEGRIDIKEWKGPVKSKFKRHKENFVKLLANAKERFVNVFMRFKNRIANTIPGRRRNSSANTKSSRNLDNNNFRDDGLKYVQPEFSDIKNTEIHGSNDSVDYTIATGHKNKDGLNYAHLDFDNFESKPFERTDEETIYAEIDHSKRAQDIEPEQDYVNKNLADKYIDESNA